MAVDQHGDAETARGALHQRAQRRVIGLVKALDAPQAFVEGEALGVDLARIGDDARYRAEPGGDAQRTGVGEMRQRAVEEPGIEFVGLAIEIEIGAGKARAQQGRADRDGRREEIVDIGVLRAAQGGRVERRRGRKRAG